MAQKELLKRNPAKREDKGAAHAEDRSRRANAPTWPCRSPAGFAPRRRPTSGLRRLWEMAAWRNI